MVPTYRAASAQHGKNHTHTHSLSLTIHPPYRTQAADTPNSGNGKKARQTAIVEGRIKDGVLYPNAAIVLQERVEAILADAMDTLAGVLSQGFRGVAADVSFILEPLREKAKDEVDVGEKERVKLEKVSKILRGLKKRAEEMRGEAAE
jgi:hypothetical protein